MTGALIRTLLVDDEPIARQVLREELADIEDVEIVGEAADGAQALKAIDDLHPDLVFLDLQMPGMGGFEVIANLDISGDSPAIVIVTAYDQYAVQAFDADAIDYVLKPVRAARLHQCLERVRAVRQRNHSAVSYLSRLHDMALNEGRNQLP